MFAHRILALGGVALLIWALPRLARRCHLDAGLVLWLGAANPLVLFHLVSGIHNEGLMIGLMLAGVELGLRALDRGGGVARPVVPHGAVVVALGAAVKLPAILALGFLGMAAARGRGGRVRDVAVAAAVLAAVAAAVFVALGLGSGLGFGWTRTLGTANVIRSWMSLSTDLGQLSGQVGILAGLGDHTDTVLTITRGAGGVAAAAVCVRLLLAVLRGRVDPVTGLGVGLGAVVLLGPVVHPWYLLWAAIPLAATRGMPRHRRVALAASALLAVMLPPTGADFAFRVVPAAAGHPRRHRHPGRRAAGGAPRAPARGRHRGRGLPDATLEAVLVDAGGGARTGGPAVQPGPGPGRRDRSGASPAAAGAGCARRGSGRRWAAAALDSAHVSPRPRRPAAGPSDAATSAGVVEPTPRWRCAAWSRGTAGSRRWTGSTSRCRPRRCSPCSGPTVPARPPPSRCAPGSPVRTRARCGCSARTRRRPPTRCAHGSA